MQLSLRFFHRKIEERYPDAEKSQEPGRSPTFSSMGIITEDMEVSDEVLYVDLGLNEKQVRSRHASVVTTRSRSSLFKKWNQIILPDDANLADLSQLISSTFTHYFRWADAIYEAIAQNSDLQKIIDLTVPILNNPIYLADSSFKMLAGWGGEFGEVNPTWSYQEKFGYLPYQVMQSLIETGELKKLYSTPQAWKIGHSSGFTALPYISKAIRKEGIHYGNFYIIEFYHLLDDCDLEIADYLGKILSTALYGNRNYLKTSTLYHVHFLEEILEGTLTDKQIIADQLRALHWDMEGDYALALFNTKEDNEAICYHMIGLITSNLDAQCLIHDRNVLVILNNITEEKVKVVKHIRQIARDFNRTVAFSEHFIAFSDIGKYYLQANFVISSADEIRDKGQLFYYRDRFLDHLSESMDGLIPLYAPAIKLKRCDEENRTEYCETLFTWLSHERNSVHTAETMFIHRNTLKNRLDKIEAILKIDLDDYITRERLFLTLYALRKDERESQEAKETTSWSQTSVDDYPTPR